MNGISHVLMILASVGFAVSVPFGMYHWSQLCRAKSRRPDAPFRVSTAVNPGRVLFFPDDLSEWGYHHRRRYLQSMGAAIGCAALMEIIAFVLPHYL
jgi:hypothetical protein